jgi:hypothetical protein
MYQYLFSLVSNLDLCVTSSISLVSTVFIFRQWDPVLGANLIGRGLSKIVANPRSPSQTTTMTEDKSTPPSQTLTRRLRSLIANLDNASIESAAKQVCGWINSFKDRDDRFRGLLRLTAELILERAAGQFDRDSHSVLGRLCKILDGATNGEHSKFLNLLWEEEVQAASVELQTNDTAEAGSWPECVALVTFAGELCSDELLQPGILQSCTRALSGSKSNLGVVVTCTLLEAAGEVLCRDPEGRDCFDAAVKTMLSGGISGRMRSRVQVIRSI